MSAQEMEQDRQRHEDVPRGLEGAGYREQGQSVRRVEPLGTVIAKKKKWICSEFFSFIWNHDISWKCFLNHQLASGLYVYFAVIFESWQKCALAHGISTRNFNWL